MRDEGGAAVERSACSAVGVGEVVEVLDEVGVGDAADAPVGAAGTAAAVGRGRSEAEEEENKI